MGSDQQNRHLSGKCGLKPKKRCVSCDQPTVNPERINYGEHPLQEKQARFPHEKGGCPPGKGGDQENGKTPPANRDVEGEQTPSGDPCQGANPFQGWEDVGADSHFIPCYTPLAASKNGMGPWLSGCPESE